MTLFERVILGINQFSKQSYTLCRLMTFKSGFWERVFEPTYSDFNIVSTIWRSDCTVCGSKYRKCPTFCIAEHERELKRIRTHFSNCRVLLNNEYIPRKQLWIYRRTTTGYSLVCTDLFQFRFLLDISDMALFLDIRWLRFHLHRPHNVRIIP